jgi:primosomal protein N''
MRIAERLGELSRELDKQTSDAEQLDLAAIRARHTYEIAYSREFLNSTGSMDMRKHHAVIETEQEKLTAEIAEQQLRACKTRIATIRVQVDTGRSLSAALRAEVALAGSGYAT